MEVLHILAKHLTKLAENLFVPRVILQVDLGLDLLSAKEALTVSKNTTLWPKIDVKTNADTFP